MFETLPSPSLDVVLIGARALLLVGALCVFALAFIRWRRNDEASTRMLQQQLERAFGEIRSLHETVIVMSARLEGMSERPDVGARLAPASQSSTQRGYDVATRLAKNGADIDELTANCGVTRHEAELLVRLHGAKRGGGEVAIGRLKQQAQESARSAAPATWNMPEPPDRSPSAASVHGGFPLVTGAQERPPTQQAPVGRKRGSLVSVVG